MKITVHCINEQNMAYWQCPKNTLRTMGFERDYMPGAVAAEMGKCSEIEALKAQAVAARSFAYQYILKGAAIYDTGAAQAYLASRAVSDTYALHRQAAEDTDGIIVTYKGTPCNTHYSASNGGYVQKSSNAWEPGGYDDPYDDSAKKVGHGSGMSQNGAENMAKNGMTYQEILAFYYPGTVLMGDYGDEELEDDPVEDTIAETEETATETQNSVITIADSNEMTCGEMFIYFMRQQLGEPYKLGSHGPSKWDCSGLTMEAAEQIGLEWSHSSHYQWTENIKPSGDFDKHGTIDTLPAGEMCVLFHEGQRTGNKGIGMVHVAGYDPVTQNVIQAGGYLGKGVHENPYEKAKKYFSHWATIDYSKCNGTATAPIPVTPTRATIRRGSSGDLVKELQTLLNTKNNAGLKVDGLFGPLTQKAVLAWQKKNGLAEDSIVGKNTWNSLIA
mgnify:CR=1 FL=1